MVIVESQEAGLYCTTADDWYPEGGHELCDDTDLMVMDDAY
jgi:hypothetical protein